MLTFPPAFTEASQRFTWRISSLGHIHALTHGSLHPTIRWARSAAVEGRANGSRERCPLGVQRPFGLRDRHARLLGTKVQGTPSVVHRHGSRNQDIRPVCRLARIRPEA